LRDFRAELVRVQHLGGLSEVHAAKEDGAGLCLRRGPSQLEAVARKVGQFLDFAVLVDLLRMNGPNLEPPYSLFFNNDPLY
jgi:hypothetical protein